MITEFLKESAEKMWNDFSGISSKINHQGIKGSSRELILINFLKIVLPTKYNLTSGVIISAEGKQSKQQDIIIYDSFTSPILKTANYSLIPIESVYATIEVKSKLTNQELDKTLENIQSVKDLKHYSINSQLNNNNVGYPISFIFAFSSDLSIEKILKHLDMKNKNIIKKHQLNMLTILDKGSIFNISKNNILDIITYPSNETSLAYNGEGEDKGDILMFFYLFLINALNMIKISAPNMILYASKSTIKSFNPQVLIPKGLIKPNMKIILPDTGVINIGEVPEFVEYSQKFFNIIQDKDLISKSLLKGFSEYFIFLYHAYMFLSQDPSLKKSGIWSFLNIENNIIKGYYGEEYKWDDFSKLYPIFKKFENNVILTKKEEILFLKNFSILFSKLYK